jgi:hypothetical protein
MQLERVPSGAPLRSGPPRVGRTEEMNLLRDYNPGRSPSVAGDFVWETEEEVSRRVVLIGRSVLDPDLIVARVEGETGAMLIMACASSFDGKIVGQEVTIRRRFYEVREVAGSLTHAEVLAIARQRVAERYAQEYHKNAILRGEWDKGEIVQSEAEQVRREMADA